MTSYVPVGAATDGRDPEKSVDNILSEDFLQTYDHVDCLSMMEVAAYMHADVEKRKGERGPIGDNIIFQKTKEYVDKFCAISQPEERLTEIQDLKETLRRMVFYHPDDPEQELRLSNPEISMLINILPDDYDSAKTLIPSLHKRKFSQQNVEEILKVLEKKVDALAQ